MIRSLRAFFLSRDWREKLALLGLFAIAVIMWGTAFSKRGARFQRDVQATSATLKTQDGWIARRPEIEAATRQAAAQMEPGKTLDSTGLSVLVNQIANETNVNPNSGQPTTNTVGQFSMHELQVVINDAEWRNFATFYQKLQERAPYLNITNLRLNPIVGQPTRVRATIRVASFEMKH